MFEEFICFLVFCGGLIAPINKINQSLFVSSTPFSKILFSPEVGRQPREQKVLAFDVLQIPSSRVFRWNNSSTNGLRPRVKQKKSCVS